MNVLRLTVAVAVAILTLVAYSCSAEKPPPIPDYAMLGEEDGFLIVFNGEVNTAPGSCVAVLSGSNLARNILPEAADMRLPESAHSRLVENGWESIDGPSPTIDPRDQYSAFRPNPFVT